MDLPTRFTAGVRPYGQDHLWFRAQLLLSPHVSDPRRLFSVTGV